MRKKLTFFMSMLCVIACTFIYSCSKREETSIVSIDSKVPNNLLQSAKTWHAEHLNNFRSSKLNDINKKSNHELSPNWDEAKVQKLKNGKSLIVVSGPETKPDADTKYGMIRKFIFATDGDKVSNGLIIEMFGKLDYIEKHKSDLLENYNNNVANDFSGVVIYYDINYQYIISNVVKDGKNVSATSNVSYDTGRNTNTVKMNDTRPVTTLAECYDYWLVITYTSGYQTREYLGRTCDNGSGSEVGGAGGPSGTVVATPRSGAGPGDHSIKGKLPSPLTTSTQVANLCVFTVMEYISSFLGKNTTVGTFLLAYTQKYDVSFTDVVSFGIPPSNLADFVNTYFINSPTTDVIGTINANFSIMATINNGTHEVFITGYNNDNTWQYFDPQLGGYYSAQPWTFTNVTKITGQH